MPQILPFKGIVYNPENTKNVKDVVAPPYDVISKGIRDSLYRRNPHNMVRLTLGRTKKQDTVKNNRYIRAKLFFESWLKGHTLVQDKKNAVYIYSQRYSEGGARVDRIGFIALMKLRAGNRRSALPHENTLLAPKLDRLNLMRSVRANLEPIFVLYEEKGHNVLNILKGFCSVNKPFIDIDIDDVKHTLWRLNEGRLLRRIRRLLRPKDIFIADGHHRYEVALTYSLEIQNKNLPQKLKRNSGYIMAYFVELNDRMLTILPTHRLIKDLGILKKEDIKKHAAKFFGIKKIPGIEPLLDELGKLANSCAIGMYLGGGEFYILRLRNPKVLDALIKNNSSPWKRLDVTVLHLFLLEYVLGIRDEEDNVDFVKDAARAVGCVDKGKYKIAFFLNPTKLSQVKEIAKLGERMPRKATYFYPKPLSGLVINKL